MNSGFETWKDVLEILIIPVVGLLVAYLWPEIQLTYRRRAFQNLIMRELQELTPYPEDPQPDKNWWDHQQKDFVHKKILGNPSEHRDFILSLSPDLVYLVSQLWDAKENGDDSQWLHFLEELSAPNYDKNGRIKEAHTLWIAFVAKYQMLNQ